MAINSPPLSSVYQRFVNSVAGSFGDLTKDSSAKVP